MNAYQLDTAIAELTRIRDRLYKVEAATARKRTPSREQTIRLGDELDGFDVGRTDAAKSCGVDVWAISSAARDQVDTLLRNWR